MNKVNVKMYFNGVGCYLHYKCGNQVDWFRRVRMQVTRMNLGII